MAIQYQCEEKTCRHIVDTQTHDGACPKCDIGLLVPFDTATDTAATLISQPVREARPAAQTAPQRIEGLAVLVCDTSYSMNNPAFPQKTEYPKLKLVANAIQGAVSEMSNMTMADSAYLAIIAFGRRASLIRDRQGNPFVRSVSSIIDEYGDKLAQYLYEQFDTDAANIDQDGTNITGSLQLARQITDAALSGSLAPWGISTPVSIMTHSLWTFEKEQSVLTIPNIRVLIYSDGAHNEGYLENSFASMQPASVLMTAFIGSETADADAIAGADEMRNLATICPVHKRKGYFLINTLERRYYLRQLFRMASSHSGFCLACMAEQIRTTQQLSRGAGQASAETA